jgi:hypothetical protein
MSKRFKKGSNAPGNEWYIVHGHEQSTENAANPDTLKRFMEVGIHRDVVALQILSHRNLLCQHWDTDKDKSKNVWEKESTTAILIDQGRKSPDITKP